MSSLLRLAFFGSIALFVTAVVRESREAPPQAAAPRPQRRSGGQSKAAKRQVRSSRTRASG
jgi:hypothetical protein